LYTAVVFKVTCRIRPLKLVIIKQHLFIASPNGPDLPLGAGAQQACSGLGRLIDY